MVPLGGLFIELTLMTFALETLPPLEPPPPPPLLLLLLLPQAATSAPPTSAAQISTARRLDTNSPPRPGAWGELCHRGGQMAPASCRAHVEAAPSYVGRRASDPAAGRCAERPRAHPAAAWRRARRSPRAAGRRWSGPRSGRPRCCRSR